MPSKRRRKHARSGRGFERLPRRARCSIKPTGTANPPKRQSKMKTQTETKPPPAAETVRQIPLADAIISEQNTRQPTPKDPDVRELAKSIAEIGQTTPAIVRPHPKQKGKYEIGAGAKRR